MVSAVRSCQAVGKWMAVCKAYEPSRVSTQALYRIPALAIERIYRHLPEETFCKFVGLLVGPESLNFSNNQTLDDAALARLVKKCPCLKRLDVSGCPKLTAQGFASLKLPPTLEVFRANNSSIDEAGFKNLMDSCRGLVQLQLARCPKLMVDMVEDFSYPPQLQSVDFSQGLILGAGLKKLLTECTSLHTIGLMGCMGIRDEDYQTLNWPKTLQEVDLSRTHLAIKGLHNLFEKTEKLKKITMKECIYLPLDALDVAFPNTLEVIILDRNLGKFTRPDLFSQCKNLKILSLKECPDLTQYSFN